MTNASPHLQEGMVIIHLLGEVSASLNWVCTAQGEHRFVLNFSWIRFSNLIGSKLWAMLLQPKELFLFFFPPFQQSEELGFQNEVGKLPAAFTNVYNHVWQQMIRFKCWHAFQVQSSVGYIPAHHSVHFRNDLADIFFSIKDFSCTSAEC